MSVLAVDPDLGRHLETDQQLRASEASVARTVTVPAGPWSPRCANPDPAALGLLILDGLVLKRTVVERRVATELFGEGDLVRLTSLADLDTVLPSRSEWKVCTPVILAVLEPDFVQRVAPWPSILCELTGRVAQQAHSLAVCMAIAEVSGVPTRIELLFWHLAQRWGHVEVGGVMLRVNPAQSTIGEMIGASRSRVSAGLGVLCERGRLERRPAGWLLRGGPPG